MGYLSVWKIQEELITELRKKRSVIPEKIMNDLRSARTLIKILKADSTQEGTTQKIEMYLTNVESFLVSEGERRFGTEYANEWLGRLNDASKIAEEDMEEPRFIPGLPRGCVWIRVRPTSELPPEKLETLVEESRLSCKMQNDGYMLVYGKDENVKAFVKKMTTGHAAKAKKHR